MDSGPVRLALAVCLLRRCWCPVRNRAHSFSRRACSWGNGDLHQACTRRRNRAPSGFRGIRTARGTDSRNLASDGRICLREFCRGRSAGLDAVVSLSELPPQSRHVRAHGHCPRADWLHGGNSRWRLACRSPHAPPQSWQSVGAGRRRPVRSAFRRTLLPDARHEHSAR